MRNKIIVIRDAVLLIRRNDAQPFLEIHNRKGFIFTFVSCEFQNIELMIKLNVFRQKLRDVIKGTVNKVVTLLEL